MLTSVLMCLHAHALLPTPSRLMVENLPQLTGGTMLTVSTLRPRFSFVPHSQHDHPGAGVEMSAYQIVVKSDGSIVWDSGVVNASAAVSVTVGIDLEPLTPYTWTAQWYAGPEISPAATSGFEIGPTENDWNSTTWIGEGHTEFRLQFKKGAATKLFVAAPGGSVVYVNNKAATDECGVSAWIDFAGNLPYVGVNLVPFLTQDSTQTVTVKVGSGFYSSSIWRHQHAEHSAARLLLVDEHGQPAEATLTGRVGGLVSADPFVGGIFNTTLADEEGWEQPRRIADTKKAGLTGPLRALVVPPAETAPAAAEALRSTVVSVTQIPPAPAPGRCAETCDPADTKSLNKKICHGQPPEQGGCDPVTAPQRRWHYAFDRNIVGIAEIQPGAFKLKCAGQPNCRGEITLQYCEVFNNTNYTRDRTPGLPFPQWTHLCQPLANLAVVADTFLVGADTASAGASASALRASFTWHGFQHVIVSVSDTVTFNPQPGSVLAKWTATNVEATGALSLGGGEDAALLNKIVAMVQAGQLSNMAAFVPTDCPTREKHAWLGDGLDVAEEAMYNFWSAPMYELFLDTIRVEQMNATGNLPVNVPAKRPERPQDISWTAAYPLVAHWLLQYYGDLGVVRDHWLTLKLFVDGQQAQMKGDGVPDFHTFGDWCAIESRHVCTPNTGPPAAAANYVLAVEAMVKMAEALGEATDQAKYATWLMQYRAKYDEAYWNVSLSSYAKTALEVQSMSAVALGAGVVPAAKESAVRRALVADIEARGHHLTVGATGQKWLLRELTAGGASGHDTALKLAAQGTYPGWGYWISQGATTCWESWSGIQDPSHPGTDSRAINPPTHNHIFLCGGVGAWAFRSLGGIAPATPGYATVTIAPQISPTLDPASANASVHTVRGVVTSSWLRHHTATASTYEPGCDNCDGSTHARKALLTMRLAVPVGMLAEIHVPLLGRNASHIALSALNLGVADSAQLASEAIIVWDGAVVTSAVEDLVWLREAPGQSSSRLLLKTTAAELELTMSAVC